MDPMKGSIAALFSNTCQRHPRHLEQSPPQQDLPAFLSATIFQTAAATARRTRPPTIHVAMMGLLSLRGYALTFAFRVRWLLS